MTPSQFDALDESDKAYIVEHWRTLDLMQAWEQQKIEDKLNQGK